MPLLNWNDARILLALLRSRALEGAAAEMGVDRSTISRRISALEAELGSRLFSRTRDGIRPTAAALQLFPMAESMETAANALATAARRRDERIQGFVRVAATEGMATFLAEWGLLALGDRYPHLQLELIASNRVVAVGKGEADMAIRLVPVREASVRVRRIAQSGFGLFASREYLQRRGRITSPSDLKGHDLLLPGGELSRLPEARWVAAQRGTRVVFRSNSIPALVAAAAAGYGIAPLGLGWASDRELELVLPLGSIPRRGFWLVTPLEEATTPAGRVVAEEIVALFARRFSR